MNSIKPKPAFFPRTVLPWLIALFLLSAYLLFISTGKINLRMHNSYYELTNGFLVTVFGMLLLAFTGLYWMGKGILTVRWLNTAHFAGTVLGIIGILASARLAPHSFVMRNNYLRLFEYSCFTLGLSQVIFIIHLWIGKPGKMKGNS